LAAVPTRSSAAVAAAVAKSLFIVIAGSDHESETSGQDPPTEQLLPWGTVWSTTGHCSSVFERALREPIQRIADIHEAGIMGGDDDSPASRYSLLLTSAQQPAPDASAGTAEIDLVKVDLVLRWAGSVVGIKRSPWRMNRPGAGVVLSVMLQTFPVRSFRRAP
jgi:hypothetical protein